MPALKVDELARDMPTNGIYLLSEGSHHLYAGRSTRLRSRIKRHSRAGAAHNVAAFAFLLARDATGRIEASYKPEGSRSDLMLDPVFSAAFTDAKERIRQMDVRYVEETHPLRQALLEMYVAVALETPFNDFDTH
ncbi:hypothetical protein LCGC14_2853490 [marine sediment metagenome]|uniref:GIY-YIG domain-containing protein n=1 Tax=marine sediment metagenome TaxID=412755 RepID=A0A0F8YUL2_9ZZZZ